MNTNTRIYVEGFVITPHVNKSGVHGFDITLNNKRAPGYGLHFWTATVDRAINFARLMAA